MKAIRLIEVQRPLKQQNIPMPIFGENDVLVRVKAAGICHTDVYYRAGKSPVHPLLRTLDHLVRRLPEGKKNASKGAELSPAPLPSRQANFLFLARPEKLDAEEQEAVRQLRQSQPEVDLAYDLVQQFAQMLRTRTGERQSQPDPRIPKLCSGY